MPTPKRATPQIAFKPADFIAKNPVFRVDEFQRLHRAAGNEDASAASAIAYHVAQGGLVNLRRGLYAHDKKANPFLVASRLTRDAVIAYDGALAFHGYKYAGPRISFMTKERCTPFDFGGKHLVPVRVPTDLAKLEDWGGFLRWEELSGLPVTITSLERTVVDLLDRIDLAPPVAHLHELANLPRNDFEAMISYAERLGHPVTAARLGVLLEQNVSIPHQTLWRLDRLAPRSPSSWDRTMKGKGVWHSRWKLVVPKTLG